MDTMPLISTHDLNCPLDEGQNASVRAGLGSAACFGLLGDEAIGDGYEGIERSLVPIYIFEPESLAVVAANSAALRLYGYEEEEFLRLTILDLRPPEEIERVKAFLTEGWPLGLRYAGAWRHKARSGRVFNVSTVGLSIRFRGRPARMVLAVDLTSPVYGADARHQPERLLFPFAEQMEDVAWICSAEDDRIVYLNSAFERVFGLGREQAYADPNAVLGLIEREDAAAFADFRRVAKAEPASLEFRVRHPDGAQRWIMVRSFLMQDASGEKMCGGVFKDVTERKEAEQRRLAAAMAQRDALVREVHHRIKNNLQGITGMLRQLAAAHPELRHAMALAITQVQTVAVIHGLQSRTVSDRVAVCELASSIAAHVESLLLAKLAVEVDLNRISRAWICEAEAVPVALILNELMFNAVKHGAGQAGPAIRVTVGGTAGQAEVRIVNPGRLPDGFDFRQRRGTGVGLHLVGSLLPRQGARLSIRECAEGVETVLALDAPVIAAFTARWEMP